MRVASGRTVVPPAARRGALPRAQLESDLGVLTGKKAFGAGEVRLSDRHSPENRARVREFLQGRLREMGLEPKLHDYAANGKNVYGVIRANPPTADCIVLGAHFDSVRNCPGANDNATGVVAVLAAAEQLARVTGRSKNVVVAFFDQEESGKVGSRAFARFCGESGWRVESAHCVDQLGWDNDGDRALELDRPTSPAFKALYERAAARAGVAVQFHLTDYGASDHDSFRAAKIPSVAVCEEFVNKDTTPHYHKPTDTYETVNFDFLASSTAVLCEAVKELVAAGRGRSVPG